MHHHGTAIRRCRPDPILLLAPLAERLERPPATQRYDACMCMGSNPGQPGKNLSKMISQIRSNLNSTHLDMIYIYIERERERSVYIEFNNASFVLPIYFALY